MNESVAKSLRGADSQPFSLEEFETRLRGPEPRPPGPDPLVELANLVNSAEDPFADLFADPAAAQALSPAVPKPAARVPAPAPMASEAHAETPDPLAGYPDPLQGYSAPDYAAAGPEMLRSVAEQVRQTGAPPQPVASVQATVSEAVSAPVPTRAVMPVPAPRPGAPEYDAHAPAVEAAQPVDEFNQEPAAAEQPVEPYAPPALRGSITPAETDPVDEFERSIVELVAARSAASGQAAIAPAAAVPAQYAEPAPENYAAGNGEPQTAQWDGQPVQEPYDSEQPLYGRAAYASEPDQGVGAVASDPYAGAYSDAAPVTERPAIPPDWLGDDAAPPNSYAQPALRKGGTRKSLYLTGGALLVLVTGIGATLALWDGGGANGKIPTITASGEKMKVKSEGVSEKAVRTVSVLQPGKSTPRTSKVVNSGEQPIDLGQVPAEPKKARRIKEEELSKKLNLADRNLTRPIAKSAPKIQSRTAAGGYFPEPRKVRTVMVRPDGSLIDPTASVPKKPAASAPAARSARTVVPARVQRNTRPQRAAIATAQRKAASRVRPVNRTAARNIAPSPTSRTAAASGGGYAVQLAAPASQSAARSVARKSKARFGSIFGGRSPGIQRAVVRSRTVYRVRVGGLSRGAASKMCSRVKAKGGACYVARN